LWNKHGLEPDRRKLEGASPLNRAQRSGEHRDQEQEQGHKENHLATPTAAIAMPPKPSTAAMRAMIRSVTTKLSMDRRRREHGEAGCDPGGRRGAQGRGLPVVLDLHVAAGAVCATMGGMLGGDLRDEITMREAVSTSPN
jgi:hypothetical protein